MMSQKVFDQKIYFWPKTPKNWSRNLRNSYKKNLETSLLPTKKQNNKKQKQRQKTKKSFRAEKVLS